MKLIDSAAHTLNTGAQGNGIKEGGYCIEFIEAYKPLVKSMGIDVVSVPHRMDYVEAVKFVNANCKPDDKAIELHLNSAINPKANGMMIATTKSSKAWAQSLLTEVTRLGFIGIYGSGLYDETVVAGWRKWTHLHWCAGTNCSAALAELGFVSNTLDARAMTKHFDELVLAYAKGIGKIFGKEYQGKKYALVTIHTSLPEVASYRNLAGINKDKIDVKEL